MTFGLDIMMLAEQLGDIDEMLPTLMNYPSANERLLPIWKDVSADFRPLSKTSTEIPDISVWDNTTLLLNEKAFQVLKDYLEFEGEFLPVIAEGEQMYLFNCLTFAKEDFELTEKKFLGGFENGLKSLAFEEDDIKSKLLFKSNMDYCAHLFATSTFKELCEKFNLEGLMFEDSLVNSF
ncbi:hypothetical protein [Litoribacillus peritrichatus]